MVEIRKLLNTTLYTLSVTDTKDFRNYLGNIIISSFIEDDKIVLPEYIYNICIDDLKNNKYNYICFWLSYMKHIDIIDGKNKVFKILDNDILQSLLTIKESAKDMLKEDILGLCKKIHNEQL